VLPKLFISLSYIVLAKEGFSQSSNYKNQFTSHEIMSKIIAVIGATGVQVGVAKEKKHTSLS
jgi:hypothetical protein